MGLHFGELAKIRGVIYYRLSPHEQKPISHIGNSISNVISRTSATILTWLPPFSIGTAIYLTVEELYHQSKRKNPKDFMNEVDPNEAA